MEQYLECKGFGQRMSVMPHWGWKKGARFG